MPEERKYRHRGYMDSDSEKPRGGRGRPEEDAGPAASPGAPRGRSAGVEKDLALACKKCGRRVLGFEEIKPGDACPHCGSALHSCRQCRHFDTASRWECARNQEIPARVAGKTGPNECALFTPELSFDMTGSKAATVDDARSAFDKLFKK